MALFQGKFGDLSETTDEDGGILIKTSSSWPQERRRGGGSSTWIKLRITSHLGAIMYVIIEDTQKDRQTGSERERNGRDRFGRRSGQSIERRGTSANNLEIGQSMVDWIEFMTVANEETHFCDFHRWSPIITFVVLLVALINARCGQFQWNWTNSLSYSMNRGSYMKYFMAYWSCD